MKTTKVAVAGALCAAFALTLSACSGNNTTTPSTDTGSTTATAAATSITVRGCTPQNPLLGTDTSEVCGGNPLDASEAKLVHYNTDNAAPEMDIAQSIDSTDATNWTVKLNQGYKFQDGTEVKAKNFVDAWNWGAACDNAQINSYFFAMIDGFNDPTGDGCNTAATMSGLTVVDDYTFTIKTNAPTSNLVVRLGYTAFAPQPDAFFADTSQGKTDFAKTPIAAGPYQIVTNDDTQIVLKKFADYSGKYPGSVDQVTFKIYNDTSAAYNDVVANNLDLTDVIPSDQLVGDIWKTDLVNSDGSPRWGTANTGVIQVLSFSPASIDPQLADIRMRQAISMGFDRSAVTSTIFNNARTPATGWVSPVVDGYKAGACGDNCTFNPQQAKTLYDAAGGYKGTFYIWVNGDGGHDPWATAVCNQLKTNLGMDCAVKDTPDFATLRQLITSRDKSLTGMFRGGWQMDYPSIENFLTPIYATGASSNDTDYSNPQFDSLLKQAAAATDASQANSLYQQAEAILGQDLPTMPLWYQNSQFGFSTKVKSVKMTPFSTFDFSSVVLN
ncbi:MAG: ABC transporter substrate-binding protein [Propionibacteriaceae bacterium]|nr:ABC transporter substrate-binding protein [Propionibacteriaceae bacterium]